MKYLVVWYPKGGDGKLRPEFMMDDDDTVSMFDSETEAEQVAWSSHVSSQWPFVVVAISV